jgi:hypothetical protein
MAGRNKNFIKYPGSGMWMMCTTSSAAGLFLYRSLPLDTIKGLVGQGTYQLYWIDTGMGAANLLKVRNGGTSASASKVTPQLLAHYLKIGSD